MKRIVSMLLACVLLLCCISGCGAKNNDDNNTTGDLKELDVVLDWYPNASTPLCMWPWRRATMPMRV